MGVSEGDVVALLGELVAIPSVNPAFRGDGEPDHWFGEQALGNYVAGWLRQIGVDVEIDNVLQGRPNVIARLRGKPGGKHLLWEGHLDTVQASEMSIDPFKPVVRDGRLYGRGAVDDKGCLAAFMLALRSLTDEPPDCDVTFVAAMDEEYQFKGIQHHLARGEHYDFGVAGEPTELRIVRACKGCVRWTIEVLGKSAHTSRPEQGIDAIQIAQDLLQTLRDSGIAGRDVHSLLGRSALTCTMFHAGQGPNTVPACARLTFDYRTLPNQTGAEVWNAVVGIAQRFAATIPAPARVAVESPFIDTIGMDVPENSPIVTAMQSVCRSFGLSTEPSGVPFGSDATKMTAAGIPSVIFGPGSIEQAHTADEFVRVAEVAKAAEMLAALARKI
jgi:succinyl-diaminopimelate desuccinylase